MIQEISQNSALDLAEGCVESDVDDLRLIMAASTKLPPAVIAANFSRVCDRVLDAESIEALADPVSCLQADAVERCRARRKALTAYSGKRLICVLINLPGIVYTVEIDPFLQKVIHWEYVAT